MKTLKLLFLLILNSIINYLVVKIYIIQPQQEAFAAALHEKNKIIQNLEAQMCATKAATCDSIGALSYLNVTNTKVLCAGAVAALVTLAIALFLKQAAGGCTATSIENINTDPVQSGDVPNGSIMKYIINNSSDTENIVVSKLTRYSDVNNYLTNMELELTPVSPVAEAADPTFVKMCLLSPAESLELYSTVEFFQSAVDVVKGFVT